MLTSDGPRCRQRPAESTEPAVVDLDRTSRRSRARTRRIHTVTTPSASFSAATDASTTTRRSPTPVPSMKGQPRISSAERHDALLHHHGHDQSRLDPQTRRRVDAEVRIVGVRITNGCEALEAVPSFT